MNQTNQTRPQWLQLPEAYKHLEVTGYLLAVNLPSTIHPPRAKKTGVPVSRFDVIGYAGVFPPPMQERYLQVLEQGDKGVLYLRELPKDETRFSHRAYQYNLALPTKEGQRNFTGLEPVFSDGRITRMYLGIPEPSEVRGTRYERATYLIRSCFVAGQRAYEILCSTHQYARNVAVGIANGTYNPLLLALRNQTQPLGWQASDRPFMDWYSTLPLHIRALV